MMSGGCVRGANGTPPVASLPTMPVRRLMAAKASAVAA
jgi:hypothetical protein